MPSLLDDAERFHPIKPTAQFACSDVPDPGSIIMSGDWSDTDMCQSFKILDLSPVSDAATR